MSKFKVVLSAVIVALIIVALSFDRSPKLIQHNDDSLALELKKSGQSPQQEIVRALPPISSDYYAARKERGVLQHSLDLRNEFFSTQTVFSPNHEEVLLLISGYGSNADNFVPLSKPQELHCYLTLGQCDPTDILSRAGVVTGHKVRWIGWDSTHQRLLGYGFGGFYPVAVFDVSSGLLRGLANYQEGDGTPDIRALEQSLAPSLKKFVVYKPKTRELLIYDSDDLDKPRLAFNLALAAKDYPSLTSQPEEGVPDAIFFSWSPDENFLVFGLGQGLYLFDLVNEKAIQLYRNEAPDEYLLFGSSMAFSSDGRLFHFKEIRMLENYRSLEISRTIDLTTKQVIPER